MEALHQACPVPLDDDDINDMTPLLLASENGHYLAVQFLINVGADIESRLVVTISHCYLLLKLATGRNVLLMIFYSRAKI